MKSAAAATAAVLKAARIYQANLELCVRLCQFLDGHLTKKSPLPQISIQFIGQEDVPRIEARDCLIFCTPVIFSAMVDVRKITAFLGYNLNRKSRTLVRSEKLSNDDYNISDLGLSYPDKTSLVAVLENDGISGPQTEASLTSSLTYVNKTVAHFTEASFLSDIKLRDIAIACAFGEGAMKRFVFDSLKVRYPSPQVRDVDACA